MAIVRIIRNFYFILKAFRKWLSISLNDGIIPPPAVKADRNLTNVRVRLRSTPIPESSDDGFDGSLKHSPIEHRYSGDLFIYSTHIIFDLQ
jgi:hypothetical protein